MDGKIGGTTYLGFRLPFARRSSRPSSSLLSDGLTTHLSKKNHPHELRSEVLTALNFRWTLKDLVLERRLSYATGKEGREYIRGCGGTGGSTPLCECYASGGRAGEPQHGGSGQKYQMFPGPHSSCSRVVRTIDMRQ
jgi:hypothetical protein